MNFQHLVLIIVFLLYTTIGACVFLLVEGPYQNGLKTNWEQVSHIFIGDTHFPEDGSQSDRESALPNGEDVQQLQLLGLHQRRHHRTPQTIP